MNIFNKNKYSYANSLQKFVEREFFTGILADSSGNAKGLV